MRLVFHCLIIFYEMCISVVINLICCCGTLVLSDSAEGKKDWRVNRLQYSPRPMAACPWFILPMSWGGLRGQIFIWSQSWGLAFVFFWKNYIQCFSKWFGLGWGEFLLFAFWINGLEKREKFGLCGFFFWDVLIEICRWKMDLIFIVDTLLQLNMCITSHLLTWVLWETVHLQEAQFFSFCSLRFFCSWNLLYFCSLILPNCGSSCFSLLFKHHVVTLGSRP